jgi:hypothetical protein
LSVRRATWAKPIQGGRNSGRKVMIVSIRELGTRSTIESSSSSEVGSLQCTSSHSDSTGCFAASPSSCMSSAAKVFSFRRCGLRASGG